MTDCTTMRQRIADLCRSLAARTGDGRFATAAAHLVGKRAGRPPIDDSKALAYARQLLKAGMVESVREACDATARLYASESYRAAMVDRLRRKLERATN